MAALTSGVRTSVHKRMSESRVYRGNMFPLLGLAFRLIKRQKCTFTLTDKDGGFASSNASDLAVERQRILNSPDYLRVLRSTHISAEAGLEFKDLLNGIVDAEYGERMTPEKYKLHGDLQHDFMNGKRTLDDAVASLGITVKTHKSHGEVVGRALRCSQRSPLKPVLRWLSFCLRQAIRGMKHLLKDSVDLSEQIKTLKISPGSKLVKIDIKDYFMSGDQSELPRLCQNHVIDYRQEIFGKVCKWILGHQYVELHGEDRNIYKVVKGSGMGLECSGDVNDLCFFEMAEKNFACFESGSSRKVLCGVLCEVEG